MQDDFGHGTHVSGIAAGYLANSPGPDGLPLTADDLPIHGVAPQARLMGYKVLATVGLPTVASATETFAAAIENGVSGFLVSSNSDWECALELLITNASCRRAIGETARARALARYSVAALVPQLVGALALPAMCSNKPIFSVDVPPVSGLSGGGRWSTSAIAPRADVYFGCGPPFWRN